MFNRKIKKPFPESPVLVSRCVDPHYRPVFPPEFDPVWDDPADPLYGHPLNIPPSIPYSGCIYVGRMIPSDGSQTTYVYCLIVKEQEFVNPSFDSDIGIPYGGVYKQLDKHVKVHLLNNVAVIIVSFMACDGMYIIANEKLRNFFDGCVYVDRRVSANGRYTTDVFSCVKQYVLEDRMGLLTFYAKKLCCTDGHHP